ncbi:MAG: leucyl/phenylalanyl-tRNA--protein transferase [Planctomycetota bacterium]|jgi:leucyl/phenylalanyl-tRNA--protein transferase
MKGRGPVWLGDDPTFPPPEMATEQGLLAIGGDLLPERLLAAYARGIFPWPWYDDQPMLWWCPDPRFVLHPDELHVSESLAQRLRSGRFEVRLDTAFEHVMRGCATAKRPEGGGTWITDEMLEAYVAFHRLGYAHSAESWRDGTLVGGLYGVALGGVFFGESMFFRETDASKVAFAVLVRQLEAWSFRLVDCQLETAHLRRFGAHHVPRSHFLREVEEYRKLPHRPGPWRLDT